MIGKTISQYRIVEKLGEGGMGAVYRAHDAKLDRDVALKFLLPELTRDATARERFMHEARAASALSHPNVCAIHDIQEYENQLFIVMDFVAGQTLRERVRSLGLKQAIDIGIQIAEGLAAAHEKGVVHRDIKPENIMIRKDGIAQIMDFGLAKLRGAVTRLTKEGSTVGTAGYMSPEQVQGQDTDHRSDIFSFGVLLYEMLTGLLPFKGVHEAALAYEIVNVDSAPMSSIKPEIPPELDAIVLECLEKDPRERTQSMAQVALDLKKHKRDTSRQRASRITAARQVQKLSGGSRPIEGPRPLRRPSPVWIAASLLLFIAAAIFATLYVTRPSNEAETVRSHVLPPDGLTFATQSTGLGGGHLALSPDGSKLAFVAADSLGKNHLMVRAMNALVARALPGTEGATYPFWSPDSRFVGFFQSGKLKKVESAGKLPMTICDAADGRGGSWSQDGVIIFATSIGPMRRVSAAGGAVADVTTLDASRGDTTHRWPHFLPDGKHFLYFSRTTTGGIVRERDALFVASMDGTVNKLLMHAKGNVEYASGYLIYLREKTLMAQLFDLRTLETSGDALPVAEPVEYDVGYNRAVFSTSRNGMLIYLAGIGGQMSYQLEWFDRTGTSLGKVAEPLSFGWPVLSPDGRKLVFDLVDAQLGNMDIWMYDVVRGIKRRCSFDTSQDQYAIWSPDGSRIIYCSNRQGHFDLYEQSSSGAGTEELFFESPEDKFPLDWSPDGRFVVYATVKGSEDLWIIPVEGERKPFAFLQGSFDFDVPQFSPDGRWMAFVSNESGNWELYACPFVGPEERSPAAQAGKWQVSTNGVLIGPSPKWNPNGRELFYISSDSKLMAAEIQSGGPTFDVGAVRQLFDVKAKGQVAFAGVSGDGRKFLLGIQVVAESVGPLTLVTCWDAELGKK